MMSVGCQLDCRCNGSLSVAPSSHKSRLLGLIPAAKARASAGSPPRLSVATYYQYVTPSAPRAAVVAHCSHSFLRARRCAV